MTNKRSILFLQEVATIPGISKLNYMNGGSCKKGLCFFKIVGH